MRSVSGLKRTLRQVIRTLTQLLASPRWPSSRRDAALSSSAFHEHTWKLCVGELAWRCVACVAANFTDVPTALFADADLMKQVASYLDAASVAKLECTSNVMKTAIGQEDVWKLAFWRDFRRRMNSAVYARVSLLCP